MITTDEFIRKAREKHGDAYDYTGTVFSGWKKPVSFTCPTHGVVERLGATHIKRSGFGGCPKCARARVGHPKSEITIKGVTQDTIRAAFDYNPQTGQMTRCGRTTDASFTHNAGYRAISAGDKILLVHRAAFLWMTGSIPEFVDHINGDRADNRWSNLRAATRTLNNENIKAARRHNKSGVLGVYARGNKWCARIVTGGTPYHLGTFNTREEAGDAYIEAKRRMHEGNTL